MSAQSNDKGVCKFAVTPPAPMVGQASSPDIMMTSGDACPTSKGSFKSRCRRQPNLLLFLRKMGRQRAFVKCNAQ